MSSARWNSARLADLVFLIGIGLKAVDGVVELALGVPLVLLRPAEISAIAHDATAGELQQDPHDLVANLILHGAATLSAEAAITTAVFLLLHGIVKVGIVAALLRGTRRLYPLAIAALTGFLLWQGVDMVLHPSFGIAALMLFDVFVIVLTWREWRHHRTLRDVWRSVVPRRRGGDQRRRSVSEAS
ncbi:MULTISPECIES: DUF2127 domain-containing protein [unclassified Curtobacterium]|uniref:DUF2127 domain-containing protein n=1 Tax=unclassified Curtobacterium TaxID=257496 RepID=UPI00188DB1CE|nr:MULTISPECIES: DUF2127 domain-containing protein [unclassified Curtobacterium]MBF4591739.1 DUF2127 domain-containing protein [Curtobacterium sp. VKM Ac-1395]MCY1692936.1 DUF2127 domain-containing protein [Curtobacterium sp. SL109]